LSNVGCWVLDEWHVQRHCEMRIRNPHVSILNAG
jgi:hypothetical protein